MTTVSVHGLGYVGLPTAALFADEGFTVYGVDTDRSHLERLRTEGSAFDERPLREFVDGVLATDALRLRDRPVASDYHLVCVPTPYDDDRGRADLSYVSDAADRIASQLRPGDTVVVESTVPPGTTAGVVGPILERGSGLSVGEFDLAFCPETVLPGSILEEIRHNDRIVGGVTDESTAAAEELFASVGEGDIYRGPDATTAEFVKLAQNTFRDTNVALANELAKVARDYGVAPRCAFALANTHPRVSLLRPGPGVGGHCLPVDPLYLGQASDNVDLIERARAVNDAMVDYVCEMLVEGLDTLRDKQVAVFGLAYKGNVADTRNSPAKRFVETLTETPPAVVTDGGGPPTTVRVHDPHVDGEETPIALYDRDSALAGADALVFMTDHDAFEDISPSEVAARMDGNLVVDTRDVTDGQWEQEGLEVDRL
jgi:UDP-N-acetyl-D-mannosaminuronic acid dehydrogenase